MFLQKNKFIIRCELEDEEFVNLIDFAALYKRVADFFNLNKELQIKILFLYSINEFNFFNNEKFEKWICSFVRPSNTIFIFAPSVIGKVTVHKKESIPRMIIHELAHIFYGYSGFKDIKLLNEGIASYLALDRNTRREDQNFDLSRINPLNYDGDVYKDGARIINKIISDFGRESLFSFLNSIRPYSDELILEKFKEFLNK